MRDSIVYLILIEVLLIFLVYRFRKKKLSNLLFTICTFLFLLLVIEFTYRLFFKPKGPEYKGEFDSDYYAGDSILGFKRGRTGDQLALSIIPGGDTIFNTRYTIIPDTLPGLSYNHRAGFKSPNTTREAVFIGCSFTFGEGVPDTSTLPYLFGEISNSSAINLGCSAYGIHQAYEVLRRKYSNRDNRDRIFIYSFMSDHFLRASGIYTWNMDGPYLIHKNDSLINEGPLNYQPRFSHRRWGHYLSFFGAISLIKDKVDDIQLRNRIKRFGGDDYDRCFGILKSMILMVKNSGGEFILLNWDNANWGYRGYDFPLQQKLDSDVSQLTNLGASVIPVSKIIDLNKENYFIPGDGHPNDLANITIAKYLLYRE